MREVKLDHPMYNKQKNLKGAYSWNKMWSLKSFKSVRAELVYMQYNISGRQALFGSSYKIALIKKSIYQNIRNVFSISITFENRDKTCSGIEKAWFLLAYWVTKNKKSAEKSFL